MPAITSANKLKPYALTTVSFDNLANKNGQGFGFQAGQPYANQGLTLYAAIVAGKANMASDSAGVAARSATIYAQNFSNSMLLGFSPPQMAVGFYYRDERANSVEIVARDAAWNAVDAASFTPGDGFAGFIRPSADIAFVQTLAPHTTFNDADQSRTFIDDISFATERKAAARIDVKLKRGQHVVVLGAVRADGGGIQIGPNGVNPVPPWNPFARKIVDAARWLEEASSIDDARLRRQIRARAGKVLKEALTGLFKLR
jgi:hypothetical protein